MKFSMPDAGEHSAQLRRSIALSISLGQPARPDPAGGATAVNGQRLERMGRVSVRLPASERTGSGWSVPWRL